MSHSSQYQEQLYSYALRLLAQRDYSPVEMRNKLEVKQLSLESVVSEELDVDLGVNIVEPDCAMSAAIDATFDESGDAKSINEVSVVDAIITKLTDQGYLSEGRYLESFIRSKKTKGYGPYRIAAQLKSKGIASTSIHNHLNYNDPDWIQSAIYLIKKKLNSFMVPASSTYWVENTTDAIVSAETAQAALHKNRDKVVRYLLNNGYGYQQIEQAMRAFNEALI